MLIFTNTKAIGEGLLIETPPVKYVDILCSEFANYIFSAKIIHLKYCSNLLNVLRSVGTTTKQEQLKKIMTNQCIIKMRFKNILKWVFCS